MVQERVLDSDSSMDSDCEEEERIPMTISDPREYCHDRDELKNSDSHKISSSSLSPSSSSSSSMIMSDCASLVNDNQIRDNLGRESENESESESTLQKNSGRHRHHKNNGKLKTSDNTNPLNSVQTVALTKNKIENLNEHCETDRLNYSVPRTVPCVVLTPPAIFNPRFPLLNMEGPGRKSILLAPGSDPAFPNSTAAAAFSSFHFSRLVDNNYDSVVNLKMNDASNSKPFKGDSIIFQQVFDKKTEEISSKKLTFGIDRILSEERGGDGAKSILNVTTTEGVKLGHPTDFTLNGPKNYHQNPSHGHGPSHHSHEDHGHGRGYPSQCSECFFLSRYCRRIQFPTSTPPVSTSFTWIPSPSSTHHHSVDNNSSILNSNGFGHPHVSLPSYGLNGSSFSTMSTMVSCNTSGNGRRKRSWSRAVFSNLQRKGLEKRFQLQKYITKPDRRQLAATLGLTDAQVKVWFQNRRMKWRHSKEGKQGTHIPEESTMNPSDPKIK